MQLGIFASVAIVAAAAAFAVWLMRRLGQSSIVAYLGLGVLFGPSGLGVAAVAESHDELAEVGVVLLLFFIGLEFHLESLKRSAGRIFGGATVQMLATAAPVVALGIAFDLEAKETGVLAFCAALSSTAIVVKSFEERRATDTPAAHACIDLLIGQDFAALLAIAAIPAVLGTLPGERNSEPLRDFAVMAVSLPALFFVAHKLLPFVFRKTAVARNQEAFALCAVAACLAVAVAAHELKASYGLGAFLGGLVFAGTPYAPQIRADLASFRNFAIGFFFFSVGMLLDLDFAWSNGPLVLGCVAALLLVKTVVGAATFRMFGSPWRVAAAAGLAVSQAGEFAFVLAAEASRRGALTDDRKQILLSTTVLSMMVAPSLVARCDAFGRFVATRVFRDSRVHATHGAVPPDRDGAVRRAVVVGYGPVGRVLCKILIRFGVEPCVIDLRLDTVRRLHGMKRPAVYGDAGKREVLEAAGLASASYLLVTLPDLSGRAEIITTARSVNPDVMIVSRARYLVERSSLEQAGADHIAYEEAEVAAELARLLLRELGAPQDLFENEIRRLHAEIAVRTGFTQIMRRPVEAPPGGTEVWSAEGVGAPRADEGESAKKP